MDLKRDERGRPVGLNWPKAPEFTKEQIAESTKKGVFSGTRWENGRPRQQFCGTDGKGPHKFPENWRPNKSGGGGYCIACKRERARKFRENNPDKIKQYRQNTKKRKQNEQG